MLMPNQSNEVLIAKGGSAIEVLDMCAWSMITTKKQAFMVFLSQSPFFLDYRILYSSLHIQLNAGADLPGAGA
jgi:hypothetical protein